MPRGTYVFLFVFDFASYTERKNPIGLVKSFEMAFGDRSDVLLVLKCAHSLAAPHAMRQLQQVARHSNVRITDCVLTRRQLSELLYLCDCYISLHRAEGFGLTLAEAMALGKPVIATGYSGNMEFMTPRNSYPVRYTLAEIERDAGPYLRGYVWAEPDLEHAAELMQWASTHPDAARQVGERASEDIRATLHPRVVGENLVARLRRLGGW
jgi:glycosyltransferase involved in cell wall biosynthesis